jgi:hypothetical protein
MKTITPESIIRFKQTNPNILYHCVRIKIDNSNFVPLIIEHPLIQLGMFETYIVGALQYIIDPGEK